MSEGLFIFLTIFGVAYLYFGFVYIIIQNREHSRSICDFNLYENILLLPLVLLGYLFLGIAAIFKKAVTFSYVQAFHKFMLQKPSDLINFRIKIEKR